jgi:uncharacterized protein (DUF2225 family)
MAVSSLWDKKLKCPFCGTEFETTRMRTSAMKVKSKDTDFGAVYENECPYMYAITVCPFCLYAARNDDFEKVLVQYEPKMMEASQRMRKVLRKPDIFAVGTLTPETAIRRHEYAIEFSKLKNHPDLAEQAGLRLQMVWIWRLAGNADQEKEAVQEALKAYEDLYAKGSKLPEKLGEPGVLYLAGELNRRLGRLQEARQCFERALASKEIRLHPNVADMTRDMILNVKTELEKKA